MKIGLCQTYLDGHSGFPYTVEMQRYLGRELSDLVDASSAFLKRYGPEWQLFIYMGTRRGISSREIKGPVRYAKDKTVELFLTLEADLVPSAPGWRAPAADLVLAGLVAALGAVKLDSTRFESAFARMRERLVNDPTLVGYPSWAENAGQEPLPRSRGQEWI